MRNQGLDAPLARDGSKPTLHATLGATLHLEPLEAADAEGLEAAMAILYAWIGDHFKWTRLSCWDDPIPHHPDHLGYVSAYPTSLAFETTGDDPDQQMISLHIQTRPWSDYEVMFYGGDDPEGASPWQLRFWAEIPRLDPEIPVRVIPVIQICVPLSTDPAELRERLLEVAGRLRLRWGSVGLLYSFFGAPDDENCWEQMYAHARRYTGFDMPHYIRNMDLFAFLLRSVSWITLLGPPFAGQLEPAAVERGRAQGLTIEPFGEQGLAIQAGPAPDQGDRNRFGIPRLYVAADQLVRPMRASDAERDEIVFVGPWDYAAVTAWLRRFEVRLWPS
jgi:hypothetical protein